MCLLTFSTILHPTELQWFYLYWGSWLMLVTGCLGVILTLAGEWLRKKNVSLRGCETPWPIPERMWLDWKAGLTLLMMLSKSSVIKHLFPGLIFLSGVTVGWLGKSAEQFYHTDSYRMQVVRKVAPYRYLVRVNQAKPFAFQICNNMDDPGFEAGETDDVVFEESSDSQGECKNFSGEHFGWQTVLNDNGQILKAEVER